MNLIIISIIVAVSFTVAEWHRYGVEKELNQTKQAGQNLAVENQELKVKSEEAVQQTKRLERDLNKEAAEKERLEAHNQDLIVQCVTKEELERERRTIRLEVENKYKNENGLIEQIRLDIRENKKQEFKKRAEDLKDRLMALARNKKSIEGKWSEAMDTLTRMEEKAQKIESELKLGGMETRYESLEGLRRSEAELRQAMENVRAATVNSMESETDKMIVETAQISDELNKLVMEAKLHVGRPSSKASLTDAAQLKEESIRIGADESGLLEAVGEDKGGSSSLNGKLKNLNNLMKNVFAKMEEANALPINEAWGPAAVSARLKPCAEDTLKTVTAENRITDKSPYEIYVVKRGDTLWKISSQVYGTPFKWPLLYKYNTYHLESPHIIQPDMKLIFRQGTTQKEIEETINEASSPVEH